MKSHRGQPPMTLHNAMDSNAREGDNPRIRCPRPSMLSYGENCVRAARVVHALCRICGARQKAQSANLLTRNELNGVAFGALSDR